MKKILALLTITLAGFMGAYSQKTLAEELGYSKDAKLLIIHADDAGVAHSEDSATIIALEKGAVTSASMMVPCPWFPEIAAYAKKHPELDWGIHLTLTAEWKNDKWGGVSPAGEIASLLDKEGHLYATVEEVAMYAKPAEVERELRAQINKAISFGIRITHLDSHMGSILASPEFITIYQKLGKEYGLPVLVPINYIRMVAPPMVTYVDTGYGALVKNFVMAYPAIPVDKWNEFYMDNLQHLSPGLNEMVFHLAFDDEEFRSITIEHDDYGAAWRQRDFDFVTSEACKTLLKKENIHLVNWGDIKKILYKH